MKKLAIVLTFVFGVAMIAPAFAGDPVQKKDAKKECSATCPKDGKACCAAGAKASCAKPEAKSEAKTAPVAKSEANKKK